ncbi:MAG: polysaccharide biosynthesis tyrosine autokinase [Planctomycetota bacterium]|nr:MAG: polysaccharide biosynthesis tyrosine autokinase [Planctomycetota bacterium]
MDTFAAPPPEHDDQAVTLSLPRLLGIFWHQRLLVTSLLILGAVLGFFLSMLVPPRFAAEATVLLRPEGSEQSLLREFTLFEQSPATLAEMEVLGSRAVAQAVALPKGESDLAPEVGLGLSVTVDDVDRNWPWPAVLRKLGRGEEPTGSLRVEVEQLPRDLTYRAWRIHFSSPEVVEVLPDSLWAAVLPGRKQVVRLDDGKPLELAGARIRLIPDGDLSGRTFRLTLRSVRRAIRDTQESCRVVETHKGSNVLRLSYFDTDPERAAQVANALLRAYIEHNKSRLSRQASSTVQFIKDEIERVRRELEDAEQELVSYQEAEGAVALSEEASLLVQRLSELDLRDADLDLRIRTVKNLIETVRTSDSGLERLVSVPDLDPVTRTMLQELGDLKAKRIRLRAVYTDQWPELVELNQRIEELEGRLLLAVQDTLAALEAQQVSLQDTISRLRENLEELPATERQLARFSRRAAAFEQIYTLLLTRLQEAQITEAASLATVDVIDWAIPPDSRSRPILAMNTALGLLLGLVAAFALGLYREGRVRKILSIAQLETATGLPQVGVIPDFRRGGTRSKHSRARDYLPLRDEPDSPTAEAYRALRANLRFLAKGQAIKTLAITSSVQGEGKSVTTCDLAVALAQTGARVLLVDADLRRPVVHRLFGFPISPGLSDVLKEDASPEKLMHPTNIDGLSVLTAGSRTARPGDLIASPAMQGFLQDVRGSFDYILFDIPPVLAVADASGFVSQLDALFMLCRAGVVPEVVAASATKRIRLTGAKLMGCILNGVRAPRLGRYSRYGYSYGYAYGYGYGDGSK